ncbi:DUF4406 domain-containing protein [Helcococcus ovis]|uniref:DUF7768 domain-containing protein n=1 Tax=Helcococcus ovis TaxID=72026 RepID=UPI0039175785
MTKTNRKYPYMPLVYICSPFSGDIKGNIKRAKEFADFLYKKGAIPITPHLLFPFMDDKKKEEREKAIFMDIVILSKCDEVWVLGEKITKGMREELEVAKRRKKTIRFFNDDYKEVLNENSIW